MVINDLYRACSWTEGVREDRIGHLPDPEAQREVVGGSLSDLQFVVLSSLCLCACCAISLSFLVLDKADLLGSNVVMPLKTMYTLL